MSDALKGSRRQGGWRTDVACAIAAFSILAGCTRPTPGSDELDAPLGPPDAGPPTDAPIGAPDVASADGGTPTADVERSEATDAGASDTSMDSGVADSPGEEDAAAAPDAARLADAGMTEDAPDWRGDLPVGPVSRGWGLRTDCVHHIFEGGRESIRTSPSSRGFALHGDNPGELGIESDAPTTYPAATLAADGTWYGNGDWGFAVNRWWGSYHRGRIDVTLYGGQTTAPNYFVCHFTSE